MDAVALTIGISWLACGLVCMVVAIPLIRGRVGRNAVYGFRTPTSLKSDEAWLAINRYGGRWLAVWSCAVILSGIGLLFLPLQADPGLALLLGFAPLIFILIPMLDTWRYSRRYA